MSSLRTEIIRSLLRRSGGLWDYKVRYGETSSGVRMRHDLLRRSVAGQPMFLLVVASEHPSRRIALNRATYEEAKSYLRHASGVKARRARLDVLLAQEQWQLTLSSHELDVHLKSRHSVNAGKPSEYWPLAVGVL